MADILIKGGLILPMTSDSFLRGYSILVEDGKIVSVGRSIKEKADEVIDARGKLVMPGLVNAHTHLPMVLFRGVADDMDLMPWLQTKIWPLEKKLNPGRVYAGSLLGCLEMIRTGTTCFADMYFFMEEVARAVDESGLRGVLSYGIIEKGSSVLRGLELRKSRNFIRKWHGRAGGRITAMLGPHSTYTCSERCLREVKELAGELGVGIHIHLAENDDDVRETRRLTGETPVKFLQKIGFLGPEVLAAHCVKVNSEEVQILSRTGTNVVHNPTSNMKLASGMAPVARYIRAGVNMCLGTDGAASNNSLDMFWEMKACALMAKVRENDPKVVSAPEVLRMATVNGARALGLGDLGTIKPGNRCDIIVVDLNAPHLRPLHNPASHMVYSAKGSDVDTVIVNGRLVMREREILTLNEEKVMRMAEKASMELVGGKR
ncbi:MAG: amidohydrolase family protein [Candidatus Hadarchaeales archaeon]